MRAISVGCHDADMAATIDDPEFRLVLALQGFKQAHDRFTPQARDPQTPAEQVFASVVETLWWIYSIDEGFWDLDRQHYRSARNNDSDGQYMKGLLYARNRCGHQRALAVVRHSEVPPYTPPITLGWLIKWRPVAHLPAADPGKDQPSWRAEYERLLAGQQVENSLLRAAAWFATAERRIQARLSSARALWLSRAGGV